MSQKAQILIKLIVCHYRFGFQLKLCDGCHDMTEKSMALRLLLLDEMILGFIFGVCLDLTL